MSNLSEQLQEERKRLQTRIDAIDVLLGDTDVEDEADEAPVGKRTKRKKQKKAKGKKRISCGNCGKPGHNAKTCGKQKTSPTERAGQKSGVRKCKACGNPGHRADSKLCPKYGGGTELGKVKVGDDGPLAGIDDEEPPKEPEITREQVQELKAQGLDSLRVAAKLKCRISEVNKYW